MNYKIISCEVFEKEIEYIIDKHKIDCKIVYTKKSAHVEPSKLNVEIQKIINNTNDVEYILLGFGLCGNALRAIKSKNMKLIIPRAHDCCTIFLGSKNKFNQLYRDNKSIPWTSCGYGRIGDDYLREDDPLELSQTMEQLIEKYGEENAKYVFEMLSPNYDNKNNDTIFIKIDETHDKTIYEKFVKKMEEEGKTVRIEEGSLSILEKLLLGKWDKDFLVIDENCEVEALYDEEKIMYCKKL